MLLVLMNQDFNCLIFIFSFCLVFPKHLYFRFKGCPSGQVCKMVKTILAHVLAEIIFSILSMIKNIGYICSSLSSKYVYVQFL